jgi:phytoene dehydrogenase-like protein
MAASAPDELPVARDLDTRVTIVGGGIAGLVAAISLAERRARVTLHEARGHLGGRAESTPPPRRANLGPHALYGHGSLDAWLRARGLVPPLVRPSLAQVRVLHAGHLLRLPTPLLPMLRRSREPAPVDESYRDWARRRMGAAAAEAAIGFASLPTFHADPGELSAAFVQERIARSLRWGTVRYVVGGWGSLVARLEARARALRVEIRLGSKVVERPAAPCIVATDLASAARLLGDAGVAWPGSRSALLDVALRERRGDASAVLSLDHRVYASRTSAADPSLAPPGEQIVQAHAGLAPGERLEVGLARIHAVLDAGYAGWRERVAWERHGLLEAGAGAADPPGSTWRDRPAVGRGDGIWLAGDRAAAPGILSEVACTSAIAAARGVLEKGLRG